MNKSVNVKIDSLVSYARVAVFSGFVLLLTLFTYSTLVSPPAGKDPNTVIWIVHTLPLLVFLPGMLRGDPRSHLYLCFTLLVYFLFSVANAAVQAYGWIPWAETTLIVILFVAAMLYCRWRQQQLS